MICTTIQNRSLEQIYDILEHSHMEMAEIRLDRCPLSDSQIEDLFSTADTPLVATCRASESASQREAEHRLSIAIKAGARYADLEIEAPAEVSKRFRSLCREYGTTAIRSYHNFESTPDKEYLLQMIERCYRYGADVAKIVTTCLSSADAALVESLYGEESITASKLLAFGMGAEGRMTRLNCLAKGAPYTYAALTEEEAAAPGQWAYEAMYEAVYGAEPYVAAGLRMPASKSFAQRAIVAAALCDGTSHLGGYSPCADSESAIAVAKSLGAKVEKNGTTLEITGIGQNAGPLNLDTLHTGESGLLTRLMIPVLAVLNGGKTVTVTGEKTLLGRPLKGATDIMASFGVMLTNATERADKQVFIPAKVNGSLIPGTADISGKGGSQLISGLLMALPLCNAPSTVYVDEPKSIPYMFITLDVMRSFGVTVGSSMEGDESLLEAQDWSGCSGIRFKVKSGQQYKAADFDIEGDWSSAAGFLVAGAVFGKAELDGLDMHSLQADLSIVDILVDAGACVSQIDDSGTVCVRKAPLEAFTTDLNNAPDLFPVVSVLAAFCEGESRIAGTGRLASKESDRAKAIAAMLTQMGVEVSLEGDEMVIRGESLASRRLNGRLLKGGSYTSSHDHRMVMALKIASLGADSAIEIDDTACVAKSFPDFLQMFGK